MRNWVRPAKRAPLSFVNKFRRDFLGNFYLTRRRRLFRWLKDGQKISTESREVVLHLGRLQDVPLKLIVGKIFSVSTNFLLHEFSRFFLFTLNFKMEIHIFSSDTFAQISICSGIAVLLIFVFKHHTSIDFEANNSGYQVIFDINSTFVEKSRFCFASALQCRLKIRASVGQF